MTLALAHIELLLLCWLTLALALLPSSPVPRAWALASGFLVAVQTVAARNIRIRPCGEECGVEESDALVHSVAEAVGVLVVPALTAGLLCVVFFHVARAHGAARSRARAAPQPRTRGLPPMTGQTSVSPDVLRHRK